jgi:hypothetical protein
LLRFECAAFGWSIRFRKDKSDLDLTAGTSGDTEIAAQAVLASGHPHHFLSVTKQGLADIVSTSVCFFWHGKNQKAAV